MDVVLEIGDDNFEIGRKTPWICHFKVILLTFWTLGGTTTRIILR